MKEPFIEKRFNQSSRAIIDHANEIIARHRDEGYALTLRQLYYRFVHGRLIANTPREYKRISSVINDAKLAGLIDWEALEDRMRFLRSVPHYANPGQFIEAQAKNFAINLWEGQHQYCEVWIEKDSLSGLIERPCLQYRVPYFACRGYASQSGLYEAGVRLRHILAHRREVTIFHLGDHDPTGLDMTRDNDERLNMFARSLAGVKLVRLAVNQDQIAAFRIPPDPTKLTDTRFADYTAKYGDATWELEALPPQEIERLVVSSIDSIIDIGLFKAAYEREQMYREALEVVAKNWESVV